jgi:hypothetical protein
MKGINCEREPPLCTAPGGMFFPAAPAQINVFDFIFIYNIEE